MAFVVAIPALLANNARVPLRLPVKMPTHRSRAVTT